MAGVSAFGQLLAAQESPGEKPKQFIYVLHLLPRLYDDKNWTKEDNAVLERHFARLSGAQRIRRQDIWHCDFRSARRSGGACVQASRSGGLSGLDDRGVTSVGCRG